MPIPPSGPRTVSLGELFRGFLKIGLLGFGGVAAVARHVIVEDRAWLSELEYASLLGIGQILPGANVVNTSVMIGDRFQGWAGALVCLGGLLAMPLAVLCLLAMLYDRFARLPDVQALMTGLAAAAAGLVLGTACKMARRLKPTRLAMLFGLSALLAVGILRLPLLWSVAVLAPLSIGAVLWQRRPL